MLGNESWSFGLIQDMGQAYKHVVRNDSAVVLHDKYPKARNHFLVLPWTDIDTVYQVRKIIQRIEPFEKFRTSF